MGIFGRKIEFEHWQKNNVDFLFALSVTGFFQTITVIIVRAVLAILKSPVILPVLLF